MKTKTQIEEFEEKLKGRSIDSVADRFMSQFRFHSDGKTIHSVSQAKFCLWQFLRLKKEGHIQANTFDEFKASHPSHYSKLVAPLYRTFRAGIFCI